MIQMSMGARNQLALLLKSSLGLAMVLSLWTWVFAPLVGIPSRPDKLNLLTSTILLDRYGEKIQMPLNSRGERGLSTPLDDLPVDLQMAFIIAEDRNFYRHRGIDSKAIARAIWQAIGQRAWVSGASTITMQLARIYWPHLKKKSLKLAQMSQALRMENVMTKNDILQGYLNLVPFAKQVVGVPQACQYFFAKNCWQLSLAQKASLAIIPRNPSFYLKNKSALKKQRNLLTRKIARRLSIDNVSLYQALKEPIEFVLTPTNPTAYHFAKRVLSHQQVKRQESNITTLDLALQEGLQKILKKNVSEFPSRGDAGAILVVDNKQAKVLSYVGSPDFFAKNHGMLDTVQTFRSPGSALKPFIYALALERGENLATLLPDIPLNFKVSQGVFSPTNYGGNFSGFQQYRYALANSKNIPALYLTSQLGEASLLRTLKNFGFTGLNQDSSHYGVGLSLGNAETSLWDMVQAYSTLARGGIFQKLKVLQHEVAPPPNRVLSESSSYLISSALSDPHARAEEFGRGSAIEFDFQVAVKTGTSSDYRDHWTIGYTPEFTIGVWKGNASGHSMEQQIPAVSNTGKIFRDAMLMLYRRRRKQKFVRPKGIVEKHICSLSGQLAGPHCQSSRNEYFSHLSEPKGLCPFHKKITIEKCNGIKQSLSYLDLPRKYHGWAEVSGLPILTKVLKEKCNLTTTDLDISKTKTRLLQPTSGTTYAIDPTIPMDHQKLRLEWLPSSQPLILLLNGKTLAKFSADERSFDWPLQRGDYEFRLVDGAGKLVDSSKINVL